jgi:ribosomal protein S18 acetylase RimI-like enzyme
MADAIIDLVGPEELPAVCSLYNQIFRPLRELEFFRKRFSSRENVLMMLARLNDKPVGFFIGFEWTPTVFQAWYYGVAPEQRRQGIASQLLDAVHSWARQNDFEFLRFECQNQNRGMLQMALSLEYDIVGVRFDTERSEHLVLLEKHLLA